MDRSGQNAVSPWAMPVSAWFAVLKRAWRETGTDNIGLIAAGVAFYGFLALVPLLGATVLVYGIVADPATVMRDMTRLTSIMPADVAKLIGEQLMGVVTTSGGKKGFGLFLALALALFGARNGAGAVVTALNVAYEEEEKRGFIAVNLLAIGITAASVVVAIVALVAVAALGHLETLLPAAPGFVIAGGKIAAYFVLTGAGAGAAATLYRYGPSRRRARWVWITPGSLFAALMWLALTAGFGLYVANFGNYNATYGSLGAVVATLTWLYLSSFILLFGAELNAELEHQTARDTTRSGAPLGRRGAWVADHVADPDGEGEPEPSPSPPAIGPGGPGAIALHRAGAGAARSLGMRPIGWPGSIAATIGLSLLKRGRGRQGVAVLGTVAALAWMTRERARPAEGRIGAVFFDLDGTLVDSNERHVDAWAEAFADHGLTVDRAAIRGQIGKGADLLVPALVPGASRRTQAALGKRHGAIFARRHLGAIRAFPGAAELLRRVHDDGKQVVLASSASRAEVDHYVALLGVGDIVAATTCIDDVTTSKPAGDIFAAALAKVAPLGPDAVLVVGDTPYDVAAAETCGIRTVTVRSGGFDDAVLTGGGAIALYDDVARILADYDATPLAE